MPKLLLWTLRILVGVSLFLFLLTSAMWLAANSGYGARVLCIATPGRTVWRIRLDNPVMGRISRFSNWPAASPVGVGIRYVTDRSRWPGSVFNPPNIQLNLAHQIFDGDLFSAVSGPVASTDPGGNLPAWDSLIISIQQPNLMMTLNSPPPAIPNGNFTLSMISFSYVGLMEIFGILPFLAVLVALRKRAVKNAGPMPGFCAQCGYDLRATPKRCPECGMVAEGPKD